jgi:hypothetical protein
LRRRQNSGLFAGLNGKIADLDKEIARRALVEAMHESCTANLRRGLR